MFLGGKVGTCEGDKEVEDFFEIMSPRRALHLKSFQ
jgi:hypothetical protein